jgi:hypothetical protein
MREKSVHLLLLFPTLFFSRGDHMPQAPNAIWNGEKGGGFVISQVVSFVEHEGQVQTVLLSSSRLSQNVLHGNDSSITRYYNILQVRTLKYKGEGT